MLALITLGVALAVGRLRGGRLRRLLDLRPRRGRLVLTFLLLAVAGVVVGWRWPLAGALVGALAWAVLAHYAWLNRAVHGAGLVAAGLIGNALATVAAAWADAGASARLLDVVADLLGDVVPVAVPGAPQFVSPGDVLIAAGLAAALATSMVDPVAVHEPSADVRQSDCDIVKEHIHG